MKLKSYLAAVGLCLLPLISHAGVIYEWTATNDQTPWGIALELEFDRSTVQSGQFQFNFSSYEWNVEAPRSGLLGLRYSFPGMDPAIEYSVTDGRGFRDGAGYLQMDLKFDKDGFLTGSMTAMDPFSHFVMASIGREFTVSDANNDFRLPGTGCDLHNNLPCGGATGLIQRIRETDVPEPASIALLAIGVAGLARTRRRKST